MQVEQTKFDVRVDPTTEEGQKEITELMTWLLLHHNEITTFKLDFSNFSKPGADVNIWFKNEDIAAAFKMAWC